MFKLLIINCCFCCFLVILGCERNKTDETSSKSNIPEAPIVKESAPDAPFDMEYLGIKAEILSIEQDKNPSTPDSFKIRFENRKKHKLRCRPAISVGARAYISKQMAAIANSAVVYDLTFKAEHGEAVLNNLSNFIETVIKISPTAGYTVLLKNCHDLAKNKTVAEDLIIKKAPLKSLLHSVVYRN